MSEWLIVQTPDGWQVEHRFDHYAPNRTFPTKEEAQAYADHLEAEMRRLLDGLPRR